MAAEIDALLENQSLKNEFVYRALDLAEVFFPIPDDIERENLCLRSLLDWVSRYQECRDRRTMEMEGYAFPPIDPGISPESDWFRFERWLNGQPVRKTLRDQLQVYYQPPQPDELSDEQIFRELQILERHLAEINVCVDLVDDVPPRLRYEHLLQCLNDEVELLGEGNWHLSGCTGYCPECFQRPWCDAGNICCWSEDEEAGEMMIPAAAQRYVSASKGSLPILRKLQAEEDKKMEEFLENHDIDNVLIDQFPTDADDDNDMPF